MAMETIYEFSSQKNFAHIVEMKIEMFREFDYAQYPD